jgi:hypothetical protein
VLRCAQLHKRNLHSSESKYLSVPSTRFHSTEYPVGFHRLEKFRGIVRKGYSSKKMRTLCVSSHAVKGKALQRSNICPSIHAIYEIIQLKAKAVPLHATKALGVEDV